MNSEHNILWFVSLENGETFYENKGNFKEVPGELSPWQKLQLYLTESKTEITSMGLMCPNGMVFNLPSRGKNPKFAEFAFQDKPLDFDLRRKLGQDRNMKGVSLGSPDLYTSAVAIYPDYELQIWVNENAPESAYSLVVIKN